MVNQINADSGIRRRSQTFRDLVLRPNFVLHAKKIFASGWATMPELLGLPELWGLNERIAFLQAVMALPRQLNMPISLGIQRRGAIPPRQSSNLSAAHQDHVWAFLFCISQADKYMRYETNAGEVATAIAEDVDSVKNSIRAMVRHIKQNPTVLPRSVIRPTRAERELGIIEQSGELSVTRIVDSVHFASKQDGPLLQIADACAFGFRRFFAKQECGIEFVRAIFGADFPNIDDWDGPGTGQTFMWRARS
jgi:hypothetical protein